MKKSCVPGFCRKKIRRLGLGSSPYHWTGASCLWRWTAPGKVIANHPSRSVGRELLPNVSWLTPSAAISKESSVCTRSRLQVVSIKQSRSGDFGPMKRFFERRRAAYQAFVEKQAGRPSRPTRERRRHSMVSIGRSLGSMRRVGTVRNLPASIGISGGVNSPLHALLSHTG